MRQKHKILLIEADADSLQVVRRELLANDYEVSTASDGLAALKVAQQGEPDLVILDIMLPGLDGFEVLHRLRSMPQTATLPILIVSAKGRESDRSMGLKLGADEYLTKPLNLEGLVACVQRLLAQSTASSVRGSTIGFIGCKGGVGTSTVVVNVAIAIAQRGDSVILVDLCPYFGAVPQLLGLQPQRTTADLFDVGEGNIEGLEALLIKHPSGIKVLSGRQQRDYAEISPSHIAALFGELRAMAQYLIIDTPSHPPDITRAALCNCDLVTMVASSNALESMEFTIAVLTKLGIERERLRMVLIDWGGLSPKSGVFNIDKDSGLRVPLLGIIPYDSKTCLSAEERRIPTLLAEPESAVASALIGLVDCLISGGVPAPEGRISEYLRFGSPQRGYKIGGTKGEGI